MNLNPIILSIPVFFLLIGMELLISRFSGKNIYRLPDAISNLSCGITQQASALFLKIFSLGFFQYTLEHFALFSWKSKGGVYWLSLFLLVDFCYYWGHRMSHEINLFWGSHVVHHQSEDYNLSVALRQSSFQIIWTSAFNLPIALLGFHTLDFALISAFNTLYQFWIHTETIGKLGGLEYIFNTPSHHRVHHGRNPKYIDKNHAGILIIWDKLFGTFQVEEERPTYGITKPLNSWNPVWANFNHYASMWEDLKKIKRGKEKILFLFKKPGWMPPDLGEAQVTHPLSVSSPIKYDTPASSPLNFYVLFQFVVIVILTSVFLYFAEKLSWEMKLIITGFICWTVMNCGVLFEDAKWVSISEWVRLFIFAGFTLTWSIKEDLFPILLFGITFSIFSLPGFYWIRKFRIKKNS